MKRKTIVGLAIAVGISLLTAGVAMAESPTLRGYLFGKDISTLTESQKTDIRTYQEKLAQLNKEFYGKMVTDGVLTRAQADARQKVLTDMSADVDADAGLWCSRVGMGPGIGEHGLFGVTLTTEQAAALKSFDTDAAALRKELLGKLVSFGTLTQAQADTILTMIESDARGSMGMPGGMGGRGHMGGRGFGRQGSPR